MPIYRIIGIMTGNSMDAMDMVLTEFSGSKMRDICSFSVPYSQQMQQQTENLRRLVFNRNKSEILALPEFQEWHNLYIRLLADAVNQMCVQNNLDKAQIDAIGFHGKTLDHNPPSKAKNEHTLPYTLQVGSGQMLADLTGIKVVYDFRSAPLMAGFEGAPLVAPHNAHIALTEGNGIYFNGGNTSNFAIICNGKALISTDAGPFNEYTDNFIRTHTADSCDYNGKYGKTGAISEPHLQKLFDLCRPYYELALPKSGDPAYYRKEDVFTLLKDLSFNNAVRTLEYFAAYIAAHALTLIPANIPLPPQIILFGGGWKNPLVLQSFTDILSGNSYILPEHQLQFTRLRQRFNTKLPAIKFSAFGQFMEARLFADMAYYRLQNKVWELPELLSAPKPILCGRIAVPQTAPAAYTDQINLAAKGWQDPN
jgi:anhydro-N-acetylmuramic acid kinase